MACDGFCGRSIVRKSYLAIVSTYLAYVRISSRGAARRTRRSRFNATRRYRKVRSKCTCRWPQCVYKSLENQAQRVRVQEEKYKHYCPTGDSNALKDSMHSHKRVRARTAKNMRKTYCAVTFLIIRAHVYEILACR